MAGYIGVFKDGVLIHLTDDEEKAATEFCKLSGDELHRFENMEQVNSHLGSGKVEACSEAIPLLSQALQAACDKLDEMGFTEENAEAAVKKVRTSGKRVVAEVRNLGLKGAAKLRDQLKEFSTVIDDALLEIAESQPDVSKETESDDDKPLPYARNGED